MTVLLRPGTPADATATGTICHDAFAAISAQHRFPADFPSPEAAIGLTGWLLSRPDVHSVVAVIDGRVAGSNFLWEDAVIAGVGPITVDPSVQNDGIGRRLMEAVLERAQARRFAGVRLVQAGYHGRSLSLYSKLGFDVREPLLTMQGPAMNLSLPGRAVRPASERDLPACNRLAMEMHGFERGEELRGAIRQEQATVVERDGRITGYATTIGFFGHAVARENDDVKALIGAASSFAGPGFLLPSRNAELVRWCLANGLRVVQPMNLMSIGLYNEPKGAFLPSILF
jgi:GNAT superfamily N-acetyltransferase